MWLTRTKSNTRIHNNTSSPSSSSPSYFSCSSFKDIQTLCSDEPNPDSPLLPKKPNIFHRVRRVNAVLRAFSSHLHQPVPESPDPNVKHTFQSEPLIYIPGAEKRIVVYFTSLRVVRSTFEDCKYVRSILQSFRVSIDERDLSMDAGFVEELQRIFGEKTKLSLPRVFIGGRYFGGAEEIRQLHEAGELKKYIKELPPADIGTCEACGGHRFILCEECSGSHKYYSEKNGFRTCTACNENGLIRCPSCCYAPL